MDLPVDPDFVSDLDLDENLSSGSSLYPDVDLDEDVDKDLGSG